MFEINLGRCILCGICVDVCNFDAIEMSHEHELSKYQRNGNRVDLDLLLDMGKKYQADTGWSPTNPGKNSGVPVKKGEETPRRRPARARPSSQPNTEQGQASPNVATAVAEPAESDSPAKDPVSDC